MTTPAPPVRSAAVSTEQPLSIAVAHTLFAQLPLVQSLAARQASPFAHGVQVPPPQSMSDSAPFFTPSVQVGARHRPPVHTRLRQSVPPRQT